MPKGCGVRRYQNSKTFCLLTRFKAQISHIKDKQTNRLYLLRFFLFMAAMRIYHSLSMFQHKDILFVDWIYSPKEPDNRQIYKQTHRQTDKQTNRQIKYLLRFFLPTDTTGRGEEIPFVCQGSRTKKFCLSTRFIAQKSHKTDKYTNKQTDKQKILTQVLSVH